MESGKAVLNFHFMRDFVTNDRDQDILLQTGKTIKAYVHAELRNKFSISKDVNLYLDDPLNPVLSRATMLGGVLSLTLIAVSQYF